MAEDNAPLGTDPSSVPPDPAPTPDLTSSLNPVTLTLIRNATIAVMASLGTKTGVDAFKDPTVNNVVVTAVSYGVVIGMAWWAANSATVLSRLKDLIKRGDIHSVHASPAIVAAVADPKVKTP